MGTVETWPIVYPVLQLKLYANAVFSCVNCLKVFKSKNGRHKETCKKRSLGQSTELVEAKAADEAENADLVAAVAIGSLKLRIQLFTAQKRYAIAGDRALQRPTLATVGGPAIAAALQQRNGGAGANTADLDGPAKGTDRSITTGGAGATNTGVDGPVEGTDRSITSETVDDWVMRNYGTRSQAKQSFGAESQGASEGAKGKDVRPAPPASKKKRDSQERPMEEQRLLAQIFPPTRLHRSPGGEDTEPEASSSSSSGEGENDDGDAGLSGNDGTGPSDLAAGNDSGTEDADGAGAPAPGPKRKSGRLEARQSTRNVIKGPNSVDSKKVNNKKVDKQDRQQRGKRGQQKQAESSDKRKAVTASSQGVKRARR